MTERRERVKTQIPIPHVQFVYSCAHCQSPKFIINEINHIIIGICTSCGNLLPITEIVLDKENARKQSLLESQK